MVGASRVGLWSGRGHPGSVSGRAGWLGGGDTGAACGRVAGRRLVRLVRGPRWLGGAGWWGTVSVWWCGGAWWAPCWGSEGTTVSARVGRVGVVVLVPGMAWCRRVSAGVVGGWWVEICIVDASILVVCGSSWVCVVCGEVGKGGRWMPWYQGPMKDVGGCDRPGGAVNRAVIPGCPNGVTRRESCHVTCA